MAVTVDDKAIKQAVWKRADYIITNLDSMTLKSCRRTLEVDMGLQPDALKPYKDLISLLIDKLIAKHKEAAETEANPSGRESHSAAAAQEEGASADEVEEEERPRKCRKKDVKEEKPRKKQKRQEAAEQKPAAAPRQYSRQVEHLRALCKQATITIPPAMYVKNKDNESLEEALEELLQKHGLNPSSGEKAIAKVKHRLQMQRELEGIDTSNIIDGGRRPRAAAQAARANYASMQKQAYGSSSEEEEEEEEGSSGSSGSDVDAADEEEMQSASERPADSDQSGDDVQEQKQQKAPKPSKTPHKTQAASAAAGPSPDENKMPQSSMQPVAKPVVADLEDTEDSTGEPRQRRIVADWSDDE